MTGKTTQRVRIKDHNGVRIYSAGPWPGWSEVIMLSIALLVVSGLLVGVLYFIRQIQNIYAEFFNDFIGISWLYTVFNFVVMGALDFSFVAGLALIVLWIPYFLIYQLSPKQFWIKNDTLFHTAYLLGFIPHKRKIPFERILNVEAEASNGRHAVTVLYERNLPKWLLVILVYWNEKLTQWPMMLMNGIPTMQEAQRLQTALLESMTQSDVCRINVPETVTIADSQT